MTTYTNIFTGALVAPALTAYNSLTLTGALLLQWPLETAPNSNLATPLIDIALGSVAASITLPPANQVGVGTFLIVNNLSAFTQTVFNNAGTSLASIAAGAVFFFYLQNNSTTAGVWFAFQYGAAIANPSVAALAGPGLRAVGSTLGQDIVVTSLSTNFAIGNNNQTQLLNWIGGAGTLTLPLAANVGPNWYIQIRNSGTSVLAIANSGSDTINGATPLNMNPGDSAFIVTDGFTWYTIGLGPSITGGFNYVTISLTGVTGNYVLTGTQLNQIGYRFTGVPTGNVTVIVPNTKQEYWVNNTTTGPFTFGIGTAAQVGPPLLAQNSNAIFYSDGANVSIATPASAITTVPVIISQGGTGATTAGGALVNLGGTSTGIAVFTAANNAGAQAAMGAPSVADAFLFGCLL